MTSPVLVMGHYVRTFLPATEGWIRDQLAYATSARHVIFAKEKANESRFPWTDLYVASSFAQQAGRAALGYYPLHARLGRELGIQALHAHFGDRGVFAMALARRLGVPLITSFYGRDLSSRATGYARLFKTGRLFLAEGPAAAKRLEALGAPPEKIRIHRLGIDLADFPYQPRLRAADEPLRLLMAGRFTEKKGFVDGLRAFVAAQAEAPMTMTIVGDAGRSPREQTIKRDMIEVVRNAGLAERVAFLGFKTLPELLAIAASHHLLVQPSFVAADGDREGGHPVVLTQLGATGLPALATRHCDIPEVVSHGRTGWLCEEHDVDAMARAMVDAYRAPARLATMGHAARVLIEEKYDMRAQTLDPVYAEVVEWLEREAYALPARPAVQFG